MNSEKAQKQFNGDRTIFSINGAEATGQPQAKSKRKTNWTWPKSHIQKLIQNGSYHIVISLQLKKLSFFKNKMDHRFKSCEMKNYKTSRWKCGRKSLGPGLGEDSSTRHLKQNA